MSESLLADGVGAREIAGVISTEICTITGRAAELAVAGMERAGKGPPPVRYAVLVLGSAGRGESLLAADQDNAIVYQTGEPGGVEDIWFEQMAVSMNDILDQAGIVLCKGGVMAKNATWRHSRAGWETLVASWVRRQKPDDLLNVDIFFDAIPVHGDVALGEDLISGAQRLARGAPDFLMMLTELARRWRAPLTMLGGFQKTEGRVDLKKAGLLPIFTAARVLALRHGVQARSTAERLRGVHARGIGSRQTIEDVLAAHDVLLRHVLVQQQMDGQRGVPLSPRVDLDRLDKAGKRELKEAIARVGEVIDLVSEGRL
jgi:CBS domain-containing protein